MSAPPSESVPEEYHFSFAGRPYTQIRAEVVAIVPIGPTERAIDVKFGGGQYSIRIIVDPPMTKLVGWTDEHTQEGSNATPQE